MPRFSERAATSGRSSPPCGTTTTTSPRLPNYLRVPTGLVEAVVGYYGEFPEEIDEEIALDEAESERGLATWQNGQAALRR